MTPLVSIEHLSKSFPGVRALDGCQFELVAGEVHALMGENGAGKSTLMKVLAGVYQKDEGEIRIDGQLVDIPSPRAAQDLGIGIIHQELNLAENLDAAAKLQAIFEANLGIRGADGAVQDLVDVLDALGKFWFEVVELPPKVSHGGKTN